MNDIKPIITVENVRCRMTGIPNNVAAKISKNLSVKVPNYWFSPKYKNHQWDGTQKFFTRPGNVFPTGLLQKVLTLLKEEFGIEPDIVDNRQDVEKYKLNRIPQNYQISEEKIARDYQVDSVNSIITNTVQGIPFPRGIVNIATNGGKTSIAIAFIKELYPLLEANQTTFLFVTHSKEIAKQAKLSIENDLGIPVGFIGDGKWQVERVTVAIVTTLYRRIQKDEFKQLVKYTIGFVADECHHSSSDSWYKVFEQLKNAYIRIGLTGTVDKKNPVNEMRLYACTGGILSKISNDYLIERGVSAKPICIFFQIENPQLEDLHGEFGELDYSEAYTLGIIENQERLDHIYDICKKETDSGNKVLILVERLEQGELIQAELEDLGKQVSFTNGTLSSDVRQEFLDNLKSGHIDVLISTAILDEGVDVSNINAVIYARGMKSSRKLLQGIGRGLRKKEDGSSLRFYDFIDNTHTKLLEHSQNRYRTLKQEKFVTKLFDIKKYQSLTWEEIKDE